LIYLRVTRDPLAENSQGTLATAIEFHLSIHKLDLLIPNKRSFG